MMPRPSGSLSTSTGTDCTVTHCWDGLFSTRPSWSHLMTAFAVTHSIATSLLACGVHEINALSPDGDGPSRCLHDQVGGRVQEEQVRPEFDVAARVVLHPDPV